MSEESTHTDSSEPRIHFQLPRRRDRAIEDEAWICELLSRAPVGTLATLGERGPNLNPNLYAFDPSTDVIYLHTAKTGQTRTNVESRPRVAFSVAEMGRLLPAEEAVHFSVEYASVVLEGHASVIDDETEASYALDLLMRKYAPHLEPGRDYQPVRTKDLARTAVYRIDIESWSGKGKTSNAPDAYTYEPQKGTCGDTHYQGPASPCGHARESSAG